MSETRAECRRLAAELRSLRARTGLTMAGLAAASTHSKSSWERYLNGKALPPWPAVQELCALAGEPQAQLRALWELADATWSGRAAIASPSRPVSAPEPAAGPAVVAVPPPAFEADPQTPPSQAPDPSPAGPPTADPQV